MVSSSKGCEHKLDLVPIKTKRWNDPVEPDDGQRLLICRFRPRGVKREAETWDAWVKELAPSPELLADYYGKERPPISWSEYRERYVTEMERERYRIRGLAGMVKKGATITLLCSSACVDPERCHRTLLATLITESG
jgi:uncharacterized protein YeaO (DUF488 family)